MKRQILLLMATASLLFVTSCKDEEIAAIDLVQQEMQEEQNIETQEPLNSEDVEINENEQIASVEDVTDKQNEETVLTAEINQSFSLLNNRLYVKAPEGTEDTEVQYGVMHAPESNQRLTQLAYTVDNDIMTVNAQELFYYSSGDIEKDSKEFVEYLFEGYLDDIEVSIVKNSNGLNMIRVKPFVYETAGTTALVDSAFVICEDNTVVFVGVYFSCNLVRNSEQCKAQSEKIIDSLQIGTRQIGLNKSTETMAGRINIDIEKGYVLVEQNAIDFDVCYIYELTQMNEESVYAGIYMGMNPSDSIRGIKKGDEGYEYKDDTILGKNMYWVGTELEDGIYYWEVLISPHSDENVIGFTVHIFFSSSSDEEFEQIAAMLRTMEWIDE